MNRTPTYKAEATHDDWNGEAALGMIQFSQQSLQFHSEPAQLTLEFSLATSTIDSAGRRTVFFQDDAQPGWILSCNDPAVLNDYFVKRAPRLSAAARAIQQQRAGARNLKLAAGFLIAFFLLFLAVSVGGKAVISLAMKNISPAREAELGDKVWNEELSEALNVVEDPALKRQLEATVALIARGDSGLKYTYQVALIEHPEPNAMALPGGRILVFTGLFDVLDRPEQVAGILAHEVAHVQRRHGLRALLTQIGPLAALTLVGGSEGNAITTLGLGSQVLVGQHYSREREREADETGWHLLRKARIDPRALAAALRKLQEWEAEQRGPAARGGALEDAESLLASHPPTFERIAHLDALWSKEPASPASFTPLPPLRPKPRPQ